MRAMKDLADWVDRNNASFSDRYSEALLDELMNVGDPVADRATLALHEEAYDPDGSQLQRLRELANQGDERAQHFFHCSQEKPDWLEPKLVARGQAFALGYSRHYGLSLTHSLFSGGLFARASLVTNSTGRLGSNPARRIQETGAFIGAMLQPGGLEPGSTGFETAIRVRLLHGSIRSWLNKSPGFSESYCGTPIDQTMLAMTLGLFDYLNLRSIARLGVPLTEDDLRAHHHMWRYTGHLIGIDERLLTQDLTEERELWSALVAHQTFPELFGDSYLTFMVDTVAGLLRVPDRHKRFIKNLYLHLSGPEWFGVGEHDARDPMLGLLRAAGFAIGSARRWIPGASEAMRKSGEARLRAAAEMADSHGFGVTLELEDENEAAREASFRALSDGVRARFEENTAGARPNV
jgi:hypothetical protein